jgi:SAM-dependent methyltransferase
MRWHLKCIADNCKALVPFHDRLRQVKYRFLEYEGGAAKDLLTIRQGLDQVDWIQRQTSLSSSIVLEIGSGWQPLIPMIFALAGASKIYMTDLSRLCTPASLRAAFTCLRKQKPLLLDRLSISEDLLDRSLTLRPGPVEESLRALRINYLAPCDCRHLDLPDESLDIITSRAVMEHIPPGVIQDIYLESHRVLKQGGLTCHWIDNSDHWEHVDKTISRVNFLRFSESRFKWTTVNSLNYQNRLRHSEYVALLNNAGFKIIREERVVDDAAVALLASFPLHDRFLHFDRTDLSTVTTMLLAVK